MKRILRWIGGALATVIGLAAAVMLVQIARYNRAAGAVHRIEPPAIHASTDAAVVARGQHLAESLGGCLGCHRPTLAGGIVEDLGPIGVIRAPNLTSGAGGLGATLSDGELARAIRYGVRPDGRSLLFMPSKDYNWWPDADLTAIVSFVRTMPPVDGRVEAPTVGALGKVLGEFGLLPLLSVQSVKNDAERAAVPAPEPTARYGALLARQCTGCHGQRLSGGKIPGAPASIPIPRNLTPHETGLGLWTKAQFYTVLNTGVRPDGRRLASMMPIESTSKMNETEKDALWAYLRSLQPVPFGNR